MAPQIADDCLIHTVATDAHRTGINDITQRQDRNLGRPATDINNHIAGRIGDWHARTNGGGNRLGDKARAACAC